MAGDWIKMRNNLDSDPRVIEMAALLELTELHVVGCLWKVWSWADQHSLDGNAIRVTDVTLDRFTCVTGFAKALRKVGWLDGDGESISFPRFAEHNGQTAKKRAETKERVAKHRNAKSVTEALPEKRREEKRRVTLSHTPEQTKKTKIEIPPELQPEWDRWANFRLAIDGRDIPATAVETILMDLGRRGYAKAKRDIDFSITKGAKSILDSDNDYQRKQESTGGRQTFGGSKKYKTDEELFGKKP